MLFENWYFQIPVIIQSACVLAISLVIARQKVNLRHTITAGIIMGFLVFIYFHIPIEYGVHLPMGVITLILILHLYFKIDITKSFSASLLSFIILLAVEGITTLLISFLIYGISPVEFVESTGDTEKFIAGIPSLIIILVLAVAARYWLDKKHRGDKPCSQSTDGPAT